MAFLDPQTFREKADVCLDMIGYIRDEKSRRILHELYEEYEAKAEIQEVARQARPRAANRALTTIRHDRGDSS
jgi:hypothetical protein